MTEHMRDLHEETEAALFDLWRQIRKLYQSADIKALEQNGDIINFIRRDIERLAPYSKEEA